MNEIEEVIDTTVNESLAATRRMKQLITDTDQTANEICTKLADQSEQLNGIVSNLENIKKRTLKANRSIAKMQSCCWCCLPRADMPKRTDMPRRADMSRGLDMRLDKPSPVEKRHAEKLSGDERKFIVNITNDPRENEMDANLKYVSGILGDIQKKAIEIGEEITAQNLVLNRITDDVMQNEINIECLTKKVRRQIASV